MWIEKFMKVKFCVIELICKRYIDLDELSIYFIVLDRIVEKIYRFFIRFYRDYKVY